ncbi:MAG: alpha-mannosidase [Mahellales bacterium]
MKCTQRWLEEAQRLLKALSEWGQPGICTFRQGAIDGCERVDYDDTHWKRVMGKGVPIPGIATDSIATEGERTDLEVCDWSMYDGPAAMRKRIQLPEYIEGLPTEGTKVYLTLTMLAPLDIYIDGRKAASYRYWGDTRQCELVVTESYKTGITHVVVFKTPQNDGDAHLGVYINYQVVEDAMLDLSTAVEQIKFAQKLYDIHRDEKLEDALLKLDAALDSSDIEKRNWESINSTIKAIDQILKPFESYAKEFKVHLIAHAHIDMNWLWDMEDTIDISVRDFKTICDIMDENPDMCFSQSQAAVYDIVKKHDPQLLERVKKKIDEGMWDVTAATWVEHDLNTSSGETFARHSLLSSRYLRDELKTKPSQICWEPDTFGHPATIPNILSKCGVKYYYHFRCGSGYPIYWWEGTDGSRVLDFCFGPYNNSLRPTNIMPVCMELLNQYGMKTSMFVFGVGDHGGGPTRNDIRIKRYLDSKPVMPKLVFSTTKAFYEAALREKTDYPVIKGEQNFIFEGCYTTKTKIKKFIRDGEARLMDAEALMAYQAAKGNDVKEDNERAMEAWKHVCFNGFHDISCGCNIKAADKYDYTIGQQAIDTAKDISDKYMARIADSYQGGQDRVLTVFNQLAFVRDDLVEIELPKDVKGGVLVDDEGKHVPAQFEKGKLIFIAKSLPALGCRVYRLKDSQCSNSTDSIKVNMAYGTQDGSVCSMESDNYYLEVSSRTGTIVTLYDKTAKRDMLKRLRGEPEVAYAFKAEASSNLLQMFYEEPHIMSAWVIGNKFELKNLIQTPQIELVGCGVVRAVLKVSRKYNNTSIDQYITIYNGLDRVDFSIDIDWQERGYYKESIPFLRVGFTTALETPQYTYELPMGWLDRKDQGVELPSLRFVNLYENGYGVSLFNDCKHGFSVEGGSVYMSLVRGSYSPDAMPDKGLVTAKYALRPYSGDKNIPGVVKGAAAFNHPPVAAWATGRNEDVSSLQENKESLSSGGTREDTGGMVSVSPNNVVVSSVKPAADGSGVIVRLVENGGKNTDALVALKGKFSAVLETDIKEDVIKVLPWDGNSITLPIKAFEIKTLLFKY